MSISPIIISNLSAIQDGLKVLRSIDVEHYQYVDSPTFTSSVGAHFRHVIEHYRCFLKCSEKQGICYDARQREVNLEVDLDLAVVAFEELEARFKSLENSIIEQSYILHDGISDKPVQTNAARELLFLQSHTIHHYALIGVMLKKRNIVVDKSFGVATATLVHEGIHEGISDKTAHKGEHICAQ